MTTTTHAPWTRNGNSIYDLDDHLVTYCNSTYHDGDDIAKHIVRCVNAHDGLVKALRAIANVVCGERQCKSEAICALRAAGIEVTP